MNTTRSDGCIFNSNICIIRICVELNLYYFLQQRNQICNALERTQTQYARYDSSIKYHLIVNKIYQIKKRVLLKSIEKWRSRIDMIRSLSTSWGLKQIFLKLGLQKDSGYYYSIFYRIQFEQALPANDAQLCTRHIAAFPICLDQDQGLVARPKTNQNLQAVMFYLDSRIIMLMQSAVTTNYDV